MTTLPDALAAVAAMDAALEAQRALPPTGFVGPLEEHIRAAAASRACIAYVRTLATQQGEAVAYAAGLEANMRGFIDVMAWREGEFTIPLFTRPHPALSAEEVAALETLADHDANPHIETRDAAISAAFMLARRLARSIGCPKCGDVKYHPWCKASAAKPVEGDYECICVSCGKHFVGPKRSVTCPECAANPPAAVQVDDVLRQAAQTVIKNLNNATAIMRDKNTNYGPDRIWLTEQVNVLRVARAHKGNGE